MALTDYPPKWLSKKYPDGITSAQANEWLNENIPLPPNYSWKKEDGIFQDWIDYQDAAWMFHTGLRPMDFAWGFPTEQTFLDESAGQEYRLQAGDLNSLDFRDPTQHPHFSPPTQHSYYTPASPEREQSWHKDSLSLQPRVESTIAASDSPIGDFDENEIEDATMENRGPEAGLSGERGRKEEGEDPGAGYDASNLRVLLHGDEEGRAGLGQGHKFDGSMRRKRRRRRATRRRIDRWVPDRGMIDRWVPDRGMIDRGVPDRAMIDSWVPDRGMIDRGVPDRGMIDRWVPDRR